MSAAEDGSDAAPTKRTIPGFTPALQRHARGLFRVLTALSPALAARLAAQLFVTPRARPISAEEAQFLSTAATRRLTTARGAVQVYEWSGVGPTVLVVHGWISHAARLEPTIEALRARGLRVVAFDAPAHGRSKGMQADLDSFRAALAAVARGCGPIAALLAHSFGALTAVSWLAEDAEAAHLRAVVLVGLPRDVGYLFESFSLAMALRADVIARLRALFHTRYGRFPEEYSALALAPHIHVPVLLIHGSADELVPAAQAAQIVARLPDGQLQVVPGLNHSGPLRDSDTVALMAAFIAARVITDLPAQTAPAH